MKPPCLLMWFEQPSSHELVWCIMSIFDISSKCMRTQNLLLEVGFCISLCNPHIASSSFLTIVHSMVSNSVTFPVPCQLCLVEFFRTNSLSQKTFFALSTSTPIMHKANLQPLHYILCSNEFRTSGRSLKNGLLLRIPRIKAQ